MLVVADTVVRQWLLDVEDQPGVQRVGLALVEGGGRRLAFTASDRTGPVMDWCHIDAYDDLPLNHVVRSGAPIGGSWDDLAPRFPDFVARQVDGPTTGLVAAPLVLHGQVLGAVLAYLDGAAAPPTLEVDDLVRELRSAQARTERLDGALADATVGPDALVADCDVEGEPRAVGGARRFLRTQLTAWGVDDDRSDTAVLCLSELVTNAVIHTGAPAEVRAVLEGDVLTVLVRDRGNHRGARPTDGSVDVREEPLRVHGRGLQLVAALSSRWGSDLDAVGTTVWFVLDDALAG
ncbi:ATP-binding protein [Nocardioides sp. C4-1]|uniref:ATP-binding protein n=1 Tax=Nocardioides sp. C4-1 TaxID=3151851 RepID=UPI003262F228